MFFADPASTENLRTKDPVVIRFRDRYWMYYTIWLAPQVTGIGIATSENLLDWTPVARLPLEGPLEREGVAAPGAIVLNGRVHLFYQSYSIRNFHGSAILHAWSDDGVNFTRDTSNPVASARDAAGRAFPWCSGRAIDPEVAIVGDRLFLYYATRDPQGRVQMLGAASAPLDPQGDFSRERWSPLTPDASLLRPRVPTPLDPPDLDLAWEGDCIEAATILKHNGLYYMFYAGNYNQRPQQIGVAVSEDGLRFRRLNQGRPILPNGAPGSWNHGESGHPGVFRAPDGHVRLFFQGCNTKLTPPLDWHLSSVRLRWQTIPGEPDLPLPDFSQE
jgi:predicted GH43/DUF377 family glycosyl hydrolase